MAKKFYKQGNIGTIGRLFIGTGIAIVSMLLFAVIFGIAATAFEDVTGKIPLFAMLTVIFSSLVGGAVASRFAADGKTGFAFLISLLAALILLLVGEIFASGQLPFSVFLNLLIFVGVFTISAYIFKKRDRSFGKKFR